MSLNWNLAAKPFSALDVLNDVGQARQLRRQEDTYQARQQAGQLAARGNLAGSRRAALGVADVDWLTALNGLEDQQHQQLGRELDAVGQLYPKLKAIPMEQRAAAAAPVLQTLGIDPSHLDFSDNSLDQYYSLSKAGQAALAARQKALEPYTLGQGDRRYVNGQLTAENPKYIAPHYQFDSESGSWLKEPGTGVQQPGVMGADAPPMPQGSMVAPTNRMVGITLGSESGNRDYAAGGGVLTSPAGAKGRMQVMDGTNGNPGFGVRPAVDSSLDERARVGRDYLAAMMNRYNDPALAWAAYNAGPGRVDAALQKGGDDWINHVPAETQAYVARNMRQLGRGGGQPQQNGNGDVINVRPPRQKDAPSGYRWNGNTLAPIPGGPADPNTPTSRNVQSVRKTEGDNRKEFEGEQTVKNFRVLRGQFGTMRDTVAAQEKRIADGAKPSAANDVALIFQFMKILDPTSVVREGEYATAKNAAGIDDRVRNAYNSARNGTFLTAQQRREYLNTAFTAYKQARSAYNDRAEQYRGYAKDYGVNPDNVARTYTPDKPAANRMGQFKVVRIHQ